MNEEIKKLAESGLNVNQIAGRLMVPSQLVKDILSGDKQIPKKKGAAGATKK